MKVTNTKHVAVDPLASQRMEAKQASYSPADGLAWISRRWILATRDVHLLIPELIRNVSLLQTYEWYEWVLGCWGSLESFRR